MLSKPTYTTQTILSSSPPPSDVATLAPIDTSSLELAFRTPSCTALNVSTTTKTYQWTNYSPPTTTSSDLSTYSLQAVTTSGPPVSTRENSSRFRSPDFGYRRISLSSSLQVLVPKQEPDYSTLQTQGSLDDTSNASASSTGGSRSSSAVATLAEYNQATSKGHEILNQAYQNSPTPLKLVPVSYLSATSVCPPSCSIHENGDFFSTAIFAPVTSTVTRCSLSSDGS